jgi:glutamine synthetase
VKENKYYAFWFTDLSGRWQQHRFSSDSLGDEVFEQGFHASSMLTGWRNFGESDLLFRPSKASEFHDAAETEPTRSFFSDVWSDDKTSPYERDPRAILQRVVQGAEREGWSFEIGPEVEGYIFDEVRWGVGQTETFCRITESENIENSRARATEANRGFVLTHPSHHLSPTSDYGGPLRNRMVEMMIRSGMKPLHCLHEAGPSQFEIGIRHDSPVEACDSVQLFKRLARACGTDVGKIVTFMPMPMPLAFGPGSGLHINLSMWRNGQNAFYSENGLSAIGTSAVAGVLKHGRALCALSAPTGNSFARLQHLYRPDRDFSYGFGNRFAHVRVPQVVDGKATRLEVRFSDPSCNIYLAVAGAILAAMDGVSSNMNPSAPLEGAPPFGPIDIRNRTANSVPRSLEDAILSLDADKAFLQRYEAFTPDALEAYQKILIRRSNSQGVYPHPRDFLEVLDC